jgi:ABC-2 type transport system ATP-binding protein
VATIAEALRAKGQRVEYLDDATVAVHGTDAAAVGELAAARGATLHELSTHTASLEDAFIKATAAVQEYKGSTK